MLYAVMPYYNMLVEKQLSVNLFNPSHFIYLFALDL